MDLNSLGTFLPLQYEYSGNTSLYYSVSRNYFLV